MNFKHSVGHKSLKTCTFRYSGKNFSLALDIPSKPKSRNTRESNVCYKRISLNRKKQTMLPHKSRYIGSRSLPLTFKTIFACAYTKQSVLTDRLGLGWGLGSFSHGAVSLLKEITKTIKREAHK